MPSSNRVGEYLRKLRQMSANLLGERLKKQSSLFALVLLYPVAAICTVLLNVLAVYVLKAVGNLADGIPAYIAPALGTHILAIVVPGASLVSVWPVGMLWWGVHWLEDRFVESVTPPGWKCYLGVGCYPLLTFVPALVITWIAAVSIAVWLQPTCGQWQRFATNAVMCMLLGFVMGRVLSGRT